MKKRLKEMEDEAAALREMQAKVEKEMGSAQGAPFSAQFFAMLLLFSILSYLLCFFQFYNYKKGNFEVF